MIAMRVAYTRRPTQRLLHSLSGVGSILEVARLVDSNLEQEEGVGCASCGANRRMLERAWQTVANEFYDPQGRFSQTQWAKELLLAFQVCSAAQELPVHSPTCNCGFVCSMQYCGFSDCPYYSA